MKFDNNSLLEQIIRDTLFEQKSSNTKIPKSLKSKKKKNDEDSEDFKIVAWTDAKLNNKATFYTNKLKETGRVPDLTSGWLNGFTVKCDDKLHPSDDEFIEEIRQNTEYGASSKYANGKYVYIYFKSRIRKRLTDIVILPLKFVKNIVKQKTTNDDEQETSQDITLQVINNNNEVDNVTIPYKLIQQYVDKNWTADKIIHVLDTEYGKLTDDSKADIMEIWDKIKSGGNIEFTQDYSGVEIVAEEFPKIGQSNYMSFVKFKNSSFKNENSINPKKQVMQEQEQWKSPEYGKSRAQIKQDKWAMPEIPKTTAQIKSETENFDDTLMSITGDMESNYTIRVNSTGFNTDYKKPTDPDVIDKIKKLNTKLLALAKTLKIQYEKSGDSDSPLDKLMEPARSYGANIETGDDILGMIPGYGLGVNFGDSEKQAARLFNAWWGNMIKDYNTDRASESDAVKQNLIIRYNERVLTKLWEWTMVQIANDKQDIFAGEFVKINNDGTWGSFSTYKFPWDAI